MNLRTKLLVAIIVVLIVIVIAATQAIYDLHACLNGFWSADSDFLQQSSLSRFYLYFASECKTRARTRTAYMIVIASSGQPVINSKIKVTFGFGQFQWQGMARGANRLIGSKTTPWTLPTTITSPQKIAFPSRVTTTIAIERGLLIFHDKSQIFARLHKDHMTDNVDMLRSVSKEKSDSLPI
jgi:hypothetical protein